ncbi:MAG: hypothetical protein AAGJ70_12900, partial [Pseudomonadota bacterium]
MTDVGPGTVPVDTDLPRGALASEVPKEPGEAPAARLQDMPDWGYLLHEFREMYRTSSSGGSTRIGGHQRKVRSVIAKVTAANPAMHFDPPHLLPVTAHLKRALDNGRLEPTAPLIRAA